MMIAFIVWTIIALLFLCLGIYCQNKKTPVGFFSNQEVPKVTDIQAYNKAVSKIWFAYGIGLEMIGIPLLFIKQNSPLFIFVVLGVVFLTLGIILVYMNIENKYHKD